MPSKEQVQDRAVLYVEMLRVCAELQSRESMQIEKKQDMYGRPCFRATFQLPPLEVRVPGDVLDEDEEPWMGLWVCSATHEYLADTFSRFFQAALSGALNRLGDRRDETGGEGR